MTMNGNQKYREGHAGFTGGAMNAELVTAKTYDPPLLLLECTAAGSITFKPVNSSTTITIAMDPTLRPQCSVWVIGQVTAVSGTIYGGW